MFSVDFCVALLLITRVFVGESHSWVDCTDYKVADITDNNYDYSQCEGYIRSWEDYGSSYFGQDRGINYFATDGAWCDKAIGSPTDDYSGTYTSASPIAQYTVGDTIRLTWPAKNHANYECKTYIPDASMKLFVNLNSNPTSDPSSIDDWTLVIDWHNGHDFVNNRWIDGVPFQNCPAFCDNTDLAVCFGDFEVPSTITQDGYYTFMWYWIFNAGNDPYTTCWEAYVTTNAAPSTPQTPSPTQATPAPTPPTPSPTQPPPGTPTQSPTTNPPSPSPTPYPTQSPTNEQGSMGDDDTQIEGKYYAITIPICVTGAEFDEDLVELAVENLFIAWEMSFAFYDEVIDSNGFHGTLATVTAYPVPVTATAENGTICRVIEQMFDSNNVECTVCDEYIVFRSDDSELEDGFENENENDADNDDSLIFGFIAINTFIYLTIGVISALLCILLICLCIVCRCVRCDNGQLMIGNPNNFEKDDSEAQMAHINSNRNGTQTNVIRIQN